MSPKTARHQSQLLIELHKCLHLTRVFPKLLALLTSLPIIHVTRSVFIICCYFCLFHINNTSHQPQEQKVTASIGWISYLVDVEWYGKCMYVTFSASESWQIPINAGIYGRLYYQSGTGNKICDQSGFYAFLLAGTMSLARCHEYSVGGSTAVRNMKTINLLIILTLTLTLTRYKRLQFEKNVKIV